MGHWVSVNPVYLLITFLIITTTKKYTILKQSFFETGSFLIAVMTFKSDAEFHIPNIDLTHPGKFEMSFYILLVCFRVNCIALIDRNEEQVEIILNENDPTNRIVQVYSHHKSRTKKWFKTKFVFETQTSWLDVS